METSRDPLSLHLVLQAAWGTLRAMAQTQELPGVESIRLTTAYRSPKDQRLAFERKASDLDGTTKFSRHNFFPALAMDIGMDSLSTPGPDVSYRLSLYTSLGDFCSSLGLFWGGWWLKNGEPWDTPHIEILEADCNRMVQRMLRITRDYTSAVDGVFGRKSRMALDLFRKRNGLEHEGLIDPKTWETLWLATGGA